MDRFTEKDWFGKATIVLEPYESLKKRRWVCTSDPTNGMHVLEGDFVDRLAAYEDTDLTPEQIKEMDRLYREKCEELAQKWIPINERFPETDDYILLSFSNCTRPAIGRYVKYEDGSGKFFLCDEEESCIDLDLYINAWMPLPKGYKE
jgi:hypothetical protein